MRRYFRAYPAISSRQQGADRLVYGEEDLRRVLWQAVDPNFEGERPSTIRLGADIYLTRPIELGAYQYNVSIEGGGRFAIAEGSTFVGTYLFGLPSGSISDVDFVGVAFATDNVALLFGGDSSTAVSDFIFGECSLDLGVSLMMFQQDIVITSTRIDFDDEPAAHSFVVQVGGTGTFTGVLSIGPYLAQYELSTPIFHRTENGVGCKEENPLLALEVNGGFSVKSASVTLQNANPSIVVGDRTTFNIYIDNATAKRNNDDDSRSRWSNCCAVFPKHSNAYGCRRHAYYERG